jgi:hypothetical protein
LIAYGLLLLSPIRQNTPRVFVSFTHYYFRHVFISLPTTPWRLRRFHAAYGFPYHCYRECRRKAEARYRHTFRSAATLPLPRFHGRRLPTYFTVVCADAHF